MRIGFALRGTHHVADEEAQKAVFAAVVSSHLVHIPSDDLIHQGLKKGRVGDLDEPLFFGDGFGIARIREHGDDQVGESVGTDEPIDAQLQGTAQRFGRDRELVDFELSLIRSGWKVNFVQTGTAPVFSLNVAEGEGIA